VDGARSTPNISPSDTRDIVGEYAQADATQARKAIDAAQAAFGSWGISTPQW
jgi:delta 1-pyrroline-5-carboxylate dehydrogenase